MPAKRRGNGVLLRVDGGRIRGLSLGHIFRCLALAGELRDNHGKIATFMMKDYRQGISLVEGHGFPVVRLDADIPAEEEMALLRSRNEATFVFDQPVAIPTGLREGNRTVIAFDDLGGNLLDADIIVNGSIVADALDYPNADASDFRLGPDYCVIGPDFDGRRRGETNTQVKRILVTFGGSDPAGLSVKAARLLSAMGPAAEVVIIMGPAYGDETELREAGPNLSLHNAIADLGDMMMASDVAVAAAGRTAYELAATGTPTLLVPSIDHERPAARAFAERGCALAVDGWDDSAVRENLRRLMEDAALRESMRVKGPETVDGGGRRRVAALVAGQ